MTTDEWLQSAATKLLEAGIEFPQMEAREILRHALGFSKEELVRTSHDMDVGLANQLLTRRIDTEPLAYVIGSKEFYGRDFLVNQSVLIPRPETEILVEVAARAIKPEHLCVDVGTGSGCLGITLAIESPLSRWVCTDISKPALQVARDNAAAFKADVTFLNCNLLDAFADRSLDVVVSNPPYVAQDGEDLHPDVMRWEPAQALYAGADGLDVIRELIDGATRTLKPSGTLTFEFGMGQAGKVTELLDGWSPDVHRDLAGIERVAVATKPSFS